MKGIESQFQREPAAWIGRRATGFSAWEVVGALTAIIVSVIGLANVFPGTLAAVGTLLVGAVLLSLGWDTRAWQWRFLPPGEAGGPIQSAWVDLSGDFLGGLAGLVLGILALVGFFPAILLAAAVIALGAAFVLSGIGTLQVHWLAGVQAREPLGNRGQVLVVFFGTGLQLLAALGAVTLGILAAIGLAPLILVLVGLICLGVAALLSEAVLQAEIPASRDRP